MITLLLSGLVFAQAPDKDKVFNDFAGWVQAQPDISKVNFELYRAKLAKEGLTPAQVDAWMAVFNTVRAERGPEFGTLYFNKLYTSPKQSRFTLEPNAFLVSTVKDLKPGKALDIAMGQGRNAVYLASKGWDVTGYDLAEEGMAIARKNAETAGARITTVKAGFEDFDYGKAKWDLIYFVYTDAPVVDPKFVARVCEALKPGGFVLIDRPFHPLDRPEPTWGPPTPQDQPNALPRAWDALQLIHYEDTTGVGDWQQTGEDRLQKQLRIVRFLAKKR